MAPSLSTLTGTGHGGIVQSLITHFLAHFIDRPLVPSDQLEANPRSIDAIQGRCRGISSPLGPMKCAIMCAIKSSPQNVQTPVSPPARRGIG
jgi:hypothetical protein